MKKLIPIILLAAIICSGSVASVNIETVSVPEVTFDDPELTIYQIASEITGCPERILRGIAFAESTYRADAVGDDGISIGLCQINEKYHAERAQKYGEYNPWCPLDSLVIAGRLYVDNLAALGSERLAITAHKCGRTGAKAGEVTWYVERVMGV